MDAGHRHRPSRWGPPPRAAPRGVAATTTAAAGGGAGGGGGGRRRGGRGGWGRRRQRQRRVEPGWEGPARPAVEREGRLGLTERGGQAAGTAAPGDGEPSGPGPTVPAHAAAHHPRGGPAPG